VFKNGAAKSSKAITSWNFCKSVVSEADPAKKAPFMANQQLLFHGKTGIFAIMSTPLVLQRHFPRSSIIYDVRATHTRARQNKTSIMIYNCCLAF